MVDVTPDLVGPGAGASTARRAGRSAQLWAHLRSSKVGMAGCAITGLFVFAAVFGPYLPFIADPTEQDLAARFSRPVGWGGSWDHPLGTDQLGRDMLARIIAGSRVSLGVALAAVVISALVGVTVGLVAGYRGGVVDTVLMGISDIQTAFPGMLAGLVLVAAFGSGVGIVIVVIAMSGWMVFARVTRGRALSLRALLYVEAGELVGARPRRTMRVHLLPNMASPLMTLGVLEFAAAILMESGYSFLGFGVQPPQTSWGLMIAQGRDYVTSAWWIVGFSGAAIAIVVLGTNLIALWLQSFGDVGQREQLILDEPGPMP